MKKLLVGLTAIFTIFSLVACTNNSGDANSGEVVVETSVGDITEGEFVNELKEKAGKQILETMVYQKFLADKYEVKDEEIEKTIDDIKERIGGEDKFKTALKTEGITEEKLRENIKFELLVEKASKEGVEVTEKEINDYYEKNKKEFTEVKASHILVDDEETAKEVVQKLEEGDDFAALAKEYSKGNEKVIEKGGDLGFIGPGEMAEPFDKAAFSTEVGEISDPVKTSYGYHVIKVTDKKVTPLKEAKKDIKKKIENQEAKKPAEIFKELKKEEDIEVKVEQFEGLFEVKETEKEKE